ncbi:MAG: DUF2510 domain-containing protein, partial [Micromonosporaceae bacterium]|nr:DUF2510 domain-containing protein [Micromonosporaceae bacterium]
VPAPFAPAAFASAAMPAAPAAVVPGAFVPAPPPVEPPTMVLWPVSQRGPSDPPPGWYADPWRQAALRFWDGGRWTGYVHQARR